MIILTDSYDYQQLPEGSPGCPHTRAVGGPSHNGGRCCPQLPASSLLPEVSPMKSHTGAFQHSSDKMSCISLCSSFLIMWCLWLHPWYHSYWYLKKWLDRRKKQGVVMGSWGLANDQWLLLVQLFAEFTSA